GSPRRWTPRRRPADRAGRRRRGSRPRRAGGLGGPAGRRAGGLGAPARAAPGGVAPPARPVVGGVGAVGPRPGSPPPFRATVGMGGPPLMRVEAAWFFRPAGGQRPRGRFAPRVGARGRVRGAASREAASRLRCTPLARREPGHDGPWPVLTDLP